jgi:tetratricopeptide (TPR) repeat protein
MGTWRMITYDGKQNYIELQNGVMDVSTFSSLDEQAQENELSIEGIDSKEKESLPTPMPISVSLSLAAAIRAHKKGKMEKAVHIYSSILKKYPNQADANYLLGVAAFERGLKDDAIAMIERAIEIEPDNASYHGKLGEILTLIGYVERADDAYQRAAELAPSDVRFHLGRAQIMERNGEIHKALELYREIVARWDDSFETFYRCAAIEARLGDRAEAKEHVKRALDLKSTYAEAHFLYGLLLLGSGDIANAKTHFQEASHHSALRGDLHVKVANKLIQLSDYDGALAALHREVKLKPTSADAYALMGDCLFVREQFDGAIVCYGRAIEYNPTLAKAYAQQAMAFLALNQMKNAHDVAQKSVQLAPKDWECLTALGVVLRDEDKIDEAIDILRKAVEFAPTQVKPTLELALTFQDNLELDHALYHIKEAQLLAPRDKEVEFRFSQILLQRGDWKAGWKAYESRKDRAAYSALLTKKDSSAPTWNGKALDRKRIILYAESGFSDAIQFIRFAAQVKDLVGEVYVYCAKDLARLFAAVDGVTGVIPEGTPLPRHDVIASLNSLPYLLGFASIDDLPVFRPYLSASDKDVDIWKERLYKDARSRTAGLVWQGDRKYRKDRRRSPGIWPFSRLFYMRNIDFFGLQVGDGSDVLSDPQLAKVVKNYGIDLLDFADTAALIEALDIVVTCDTATAHLAGAMGKPVWMVLPYAVDWRWGMPRDIEGETTPWYPTMTIFRQSVAGDWADVFARIGQASDRFVR